MSAAPPLIVAPAAPAPGNIRAKYSCALDRFLAELTAAQIGQTCNQYREWVAGLDSGPGAPARRLANLAEHLNARAGKTTLLIVGEAPGYLGCRFSGVAFTSERQLAAEQRTSTHPAGWAEPSATIVTGALTALAIDAHTVRWNAVPTHPHRPGEPRSNRTPTAREIAQGRELLHALIAVVSPRTIVAVGRVAGRLLPDVPCVRHPARGGATLFRQGLADLHSDGAAASST
ncbi:MAG: uracil-DNA glycosylase [Chloroflexi bacterium]|nr:uracil-DNA glycosylase [Chloroflexota bacterium]